MTKSNIKQLFLDYFFPKNNLKYLKMKYLDQYKKVKELYTESLNGKIFPVALKSELEILVLLEIKLFKHHSIKGFEVPESFIKKEEELNFVIIDSTPKYYASELFKIIYKNKNRPLNRPI